MRTIKKMDKNNLRAKYCTPKYVLTKNYDINKNFSYSEPNGNGEHLHDVIFSTNFMYPAQFFQIKCLVTYINRRNQILCLFQCQKKNCKSFPYIVFFKKVVIICIVECIPASIYKIFSSLIFEKLL